MRKINLESIQFSNYNTDLDKKLKPAKPVKRTRSIERAESKVIENKVSQKERQPKTRSKLDQKFVRIMTIGLLFEGGILGIHSAQAKKHEVRPVKPNKSPIVRVIKPEELKESLVKKEETYNPEAKVEKLSQKAYEVFLTNQELMRRLEQNRLIYEEAAKKTGVDWKIIAAIHYREAGMSSSHSTVSGEKLGHENPDNKKMTCHSLLESAIETGNIFKRNLQFAYKREYSLDQETLERGFLAYNRGGSYAARNVSPDKSPYVLNFYNENYDNMVWPDSEAEPTNLRGQVNQMYGAFTVYKILEQAEVEGRIDL